MIRLLCLFLFCLTAAAQSPSVLLFGRTAASAGPPVTGFTMWIDPSDASTVFTNNPPTTLAANQDLIRFIKDKSAHGTNNLTLLGITDAPQYRTTNMFSTGLAGCWAGNLLATNTDFEISTNKGAVTIFIVAKFLTGYSADAEPTLIGWGDVGRVTAGLQLESAVGFALKEYTIPSFASITTAANATSNDVAYAWCLQFDASLGASSFFSLWSGYSRYTPTLTSDLLPLKQVFGVGRYSILTGNLRWGGTWSEVIVYPSALSGLQITNTMNYLIPKWGTRSGP